jgi:two-component system sensor histidine kinase KdpD
MFQYSGERPDPDALLHTIQHTERKHTRKGRLKIFLGYAAGVGKTYSMLDDAHEKFRSGIDIVVGYIEPHTRPETMELLEGLPTLPPKDVAYRNLTLKDFDLDAALARRPEIILVDELAHTNAPGMRNKKRYQDVEELLNAGIDVYTTVNIQHIESLNDIVQKITKVIVRETVPDYILDRAETVELIDFSPEELLKRFEEGKIYRPTRVETAVQSFFTTENLRLLRELAMRKAADRLSQDNQNSVSMGAKTVATKLMVCVSNSPSSAKSIRWTARTAEAFHAPWVAVYVDDLTGSSEAEARINLDLAKTLGAETVRLSGPDVAVSIAEYAKLSGITNLVIGKSKGVKSIRRIFETDMEDRLLSILANVDIHIIPGTYQQAPGRRRSKRIRGDFYFSWTDALKTIGIMIAATLISKGLQILDIGDQNVIMVYLLSVLIISRITMGHLYGMVSSVFSVLLFDFFFTDPIHTFTAIQPGSPITFAVMFLAAFITSTMTVRIRTQVRLSVEREHRTMMLYEINKKLLATRGLTNIITLINEYIVKIFGRSVIFYYEDPETGSRGHFTESYSDLDADFLHKEEERAVAHWVFVNKKNAGAGTDTLMGAKGYYLPMISQGKVLGVIGVSCASGALDQNNRLFLRMLASQAAMALERQYLSDEQRRILVETEKEKMRSNLLRAISHDLRTPLTGILGSSLTILENERLEQEVKNQLLVNIKEDSQWLIRMVENLLSVTRIHEGTMHVTKSPEAAEEVAGEAVAQIRKRYPGRRIAVKVPQDLLMIPMDGTLIMQVLINLMENAVKHSRAESIVELNITQDVDYAVFEVSDQGEGIPEGEMPLLFEGYAAGEKHSSDSSRGMGIGLSICMSIIKAHSGTLEAENRKEGGSLFRFQLPLETKTAILP